MASPTLRKPDDVLPPEYFSRLAANAPLILAIGFVGLLFGLVVAAFAVLLLFQVDFPAAAGMVFFMASLILTPSIHLLHYRAEIVRASTADGDALARVLRQQMRFWRFIGVSIIVWMTMVGIAVVRWT
ncbi:MAG TPA: hypothetical protein VGQ76_12920 [Thermoanaerobaculia bacterium]|nr:hypothetical protein [Thermoanaerobaculia bacterium]